MSAALGFGPRTETEAELMDRIFQSPLLNNRSRGSRLREILEVLWRAYVQSPGERVAEREIAMEVFGGPVDIDDSQVRAAVARVRKFLDNYFQSELLLGTLCVRVPKREYRLDFHRRETQLAMSPIDWFWSDFRSTSQVSTGVVGESDYDPPKAVRRHPESVFRAEDILRMFRFFCEIPVEQPEVIDGDEAANPSLRGNRAYLITGLSYTRRDALEPVLPTRPLEKRPEEWPLLIPFEDPTGKTIISDCDPQDGEPPVYVDTRDKIYGLVTFRAAAEEQPTIISVVSSRGKMIERIMECLVSIEGLEAVIKDPCFAGAQIQNPRPRIFQILFEASAWEQHDQYDEGTLSSYGLGEAVPVLRRVIVAPKARPALPAPTIVEPSEESWEAEDSFPN